MNAQHRREIPQYLLGIWENELPECAQAVEVEKLIEPDHPARALGELVGRLDLSGFRAEIESVEGEAGRPASDPQLLISVGIYASSEGVSSVREVVRRAVAPA